MLEASGRSARRGNNYLARATAGVWCLNDLRHCIFSKWKGWDFGSPFGWMAGGIDGGKNLDWNRDYGRSMVLIFNASMYYN